MHKALFILSIIALVIISLYYSVRLYFILSEKKKLPKIISNKKNVPVPLRRNSILLAESIDYAANIISGKEKAEGMDTMNEKGKEIMESLRYMNENAAENILTTLRFTSISRDTDETVLREEAERAEIPLWLLLVKKSMEQSIPNIKFSSATPAAVHLSISKTA